MGLLRRLLSGPAPPRSIRATIYSGHETLEVVGESHYQDALWAIVGGFRVDRVRCHCVAVLLPEPDNPYDENAIRVLVDGRLVGYLSREDAFAYLPGLRRLMASCETGHVALEGQIVGGGDRGGRIGFLGVFLDHNPSQFGIAPHYTSGGSIRTGLSEAIATDLADDSYDLSWLNELSDDDDTAVGQLRAFLEDERDPIDRHYMLSELATRLYRCREARSAALGEFDAACTQHHHEMSVIRPALLEKFGAVPVIEMYRQAAIRCQKARRWDDVRAWAQRGLDVYGDEAARPEVVADLEKRLARAASKIDAPSRPSEPNVRSTTVTAAVAIETLICASCGTNFQRQRTRGRKPKSCPACRGDTAPVAVA